MNRTNVVVVIAILTLFGSIAFYVISHDNMEAACKAEGGVFLHTAADSHICVKPWEVTYL